MDNRSMADRGFTLSEMDSREFVGHIRRNDLTGANHLIGIVWSDRSGNVKAVERLDYIKNEWEIWVK